MGRAPRPPRTVREPFHPEHSLQQPREHALRPQCRQHLERSDVGGKITNGSTISADQNRLNGRFSHSSPIAASLSLRRSLSCLSNAHRRQLERELRLPAAGRSAWTVIAVVWDGPHGLDVLPITLDRESDGTISVGVLRPTPHSSDARLGRAGPDVDALAGKRVALFGLGSVGSQVATTLASSGCGFLRLIDGDLLLPVNLVRHAAPGFFEGRPQGGRDEGAA